MTAAFPSRSYPTPRTDATDLGQGFPVDFTIATSPDGSNWTTRVAKDDLPKPITTQVYPFERIQARYIRVRGTELRANPNDSNQFRMVLTEISVRDRSPAGAGLVLTNAHHHRNLQGTAAPYQSSLSVHDVVITTIT